ncbi:MAG: DUF4405 domain-containing protein [bacterium]
MKRISKLNQNLIIDLLLFITGLLLAFSGLLITIKYHAGSLPKNTQSLMFDYYSWSLFHKVFSVMFFLLVSYHIYLHKEWYLKHFINRTADKKKSFVPTFLFIATALTGFIPWFIGLFLSSGSSINLWHGIIEIHDKLGTFLIIMMLIHLKSKYSWIKAMIIKVFRGNKQSVKQVG